MIINFNVRNFTTNGNIVQYQVPLNAYILQYPGVKRVICYGKITNTVPGSSYFLFDTTTSNPSVFTIDGVDIPDQVIPVVGWLGLSYGSSGPAINRPYDQFLQIRLVNGLFSVERSVTSSNWSNIAVYPTGTNVNTGETIPGSELAVYLELNLPNYEFKHVEYYPEAPIPNIVSAITSLDEYIGPTGPPDNTMPDGYTGSTGA